MPDNNLVAPPDYWIAGAIEPKAATENRWHGQPTGGPKNEGTALAARRNAFATLEDFAAWRKGKGFPSVPTHVLQELFAKYKGEPVPEGAKTESAMLVHERETRTVGAGDAGAHVGRYTGRF